MRGFTLIEVLLTIGLLGVVLGIGLTVLSSGGYTDNVNVAARLGMYELRRAQAYARSGEEDSSWGVLFSDESMTLFKGASFASRDTDYDVVTSVPGQVDWSGDLEMVFSPPFGIPSAFGTTTIAEGNDSVDVYVTQYGSVRYE